MHRYRMPAGMRYSTLAERKQYYKEEFDFRHFKRWMGDRFTDKIVYAMIPGFHTGVFQKSQARIAKRTILIDEYQSLDDVVRQFMHYLPEAVYYDRGVYTEVGHPAKAYRSPWKRRWFAGQELAFDIDPENVVCPIHGGLEQKMKSHQGLGFCWIEFEEVRDQTIRLWEQLEPKYEELALVYSGRGFHIHVRDKRADRMSKGARRKLARKLIDQGYAIDEWVTAGGSRLIRLPYSLHGMVSRIVLPLSIKQAERFDPVKDKKARPSFL